MHRCKIKPQPASSLIYPTKTKKSVTILKLRVAFQVRKQLEELLSRNGELSRANTELRHKITEVDYKNKELKDRILSQKSQIEHLTKVKKKQEETMDSFEARANFFICQKSENICINTMIL